MVFTDPVVVVSLVRVVGGIGVETRSDLVPKLEIIIARRLRIKPTSYRTEETVLCQHLATLGIEGANH